MLRRFYFLFLPTYIYVYSFREHKSQLKINNR